MARTVKSKKTQTKTRVSGVDLYRKRLLEQQTQIMSLYEHDLRVGQQASDEGSEDIVDRANNSYNREFMFALSDTERQILLEIEQALERLDEDNYGTCLNCEDDIPKMRLKAVPWTRYCVDCQEKVESGVILDN